ncbi:hypothetical protein GIB67_033839, partial [Kingdonia uniflora]
FEISHYSRLLIRSIRPVTETYNIAIQIYTLSEGRLLSQLIRFGRDTRYIAIQHLIPLFSIRPIHTRIQHRCNYISLHGHLLVQPIRPCIEITKQKTFSNQQLTIFLQ